MAGASRHDEEVPQLVETEDSGHQVGTFQAIDQGASAIDEATAEDPRYAACWYRPEDCKGGDHGEPPHSQIDSYREPARASIHRSLSTMPHNANVQMRSSNPARQPPSSASTHIGVYVPAIRMKIVM